MSFYSQTYKQLPLITAPKIPTDLLQDLSFLFVGLAILYFIFVFFYRNRISKRLSKVKERKKELSPMISEFLFHEEDATKDEKSNYVNLKIEIRQLIKDDFNRKVLSEVLLDLRKDVSGDTQKRLFRLYQDLGLHNDDFERLKSWRWETVSKAIINLTQMQVSEAYIFLTKFINDKRNTVRKQAEIAVVTLKTEGINYFLDTTKYRISEWQQLKLMDVLRNNLDYQPPRFKAWLTSTNRHVVLFALRLIKYYNQNDADAALIELVKHKNNQIKEEAIGCIKEFRIVEAIPILKLVFWKCSIDVKISILGAIGALGEESDIEFLSLIEKKESNFAVRSKAHSSINAIVPDSIMPSKGLLKTAKCTIPEDIKIKKNQSDEPDEIEVIINSETEFLNDISKSIEEKIHTEDSEIQEHEEITWHFSNEPTKQPEEISTDDDKSSIMAENQESKKLESTEEKIEASESETLCFDFLPFVVEEGVQSKEIKADTQHEPTNLLKDIMVDFEEENGKTGGKIEEDKRPSFEITDEDLAFLPIVTERIEECQEVNTIENLSEDIPLINEIEVRFEEVLDKSSNNEFDYTSSYAQYSTDEILNTIVRWEELTTSPNEIQSEPDSNPQSPETLKEDDMGAKSIENQKSLESYETMAPQNEQKFKNIISGLIDFDDYQNTEEIQEEFQFGPLLEFADEFLDSNSSITTEETENNSDSKKETIKDQERARLRIPKAIHNKNNIEDFIEYQTNTEESRWQLLDDISEMGDQRELPLLNELLADVNYASLRYRIEELIEKFTVVSNSKAVDTLPKPFNVFENLFQSCDTEAKLILLDEIVAIGDEAEINFLEGLLENQETVIRKKAAKVLKELKKKQSNLNAEKKSKNQPKEIDSKLTKMEANIEKETLEVYNSLMEELEIQPPQSSEIFEFNFELSESSEEETSTITTERKNSKETLIGQICAFSNKIIDKLNG